VKFNCKKRVFVQSQALEENIKKLFFLIFSPQIGSKDNFCKISPKVIFFFQDVFQKDQIKKRTKI
jgi:hypothetical protein